LISPDISSDEFTKVVMEILDEYHKVKTKESGSHQIEIDMIKKVRK